MKHSWRTAAILASALILGFVLGLAGVPNDADEPPLAPPPTQTTVVATPAGNLFLSVQAPQHPGAEVYNVFSANVSLPLGTGPLLGLVPDQLTWFSIFQPLGTPPFRVLLDANGSFTFVIPGAAAPPGTVVDLVSVVVLGGVIVDVSAPVRFTF